MTGESRTRWLSDHSMRLWIIKLYFIFIYSAWIHIYKHSYIHILSLTSYWSIIAATTWGHSVLPRPKWAAARDYGIGSLLELGQPWGWCWTLACKVETVKGSSGATRSTSHRELHPWACPWTSLHQSLAIYSFNEMTTLGSSQSAITKQEKSQHSHHFWKRTKLSELPRSFGSLGSNPSFQILILLQNDWVLISQHEF